MVDLPITSGGHGLSFVVVLLIVGRVVRIVEKNDEFSELDDTSVDTIVDEEVDDSISGLIEGVDEN